MIEQPDRARAIEAAIRIMDGRYRTSAIADALLEAEAQGVESSTCSDTDFHRMERAKRAADLRAQKGVANG